MPAWLLSLLKSVFALWVAKKAGASEQRADDAQAAVAQQTQESQAIVQAVKAAPADPDALRKRLTEGDGV